jgi:hypothetical protein
MFDIPAAKALTGSDHRRDAADRHRPDSILLEVAIEALDAIAMQPHASAPAIHDAASCQPAE